MGLGSSACDHIRSFFFLFPYFDYLRRGSDEQKRLRNSISSHRMWCPKPYTSKSTNERIRRTRRSTIRESTSISTVARSSNITSASHRRDSSSAFWVSLWPIWRLASFKNRCNIQGKCSYSNESFLCSCRVKEVYGENDRFTYILSLVFFQCIFNAVVSKASKDRRHFRTGHCKHCCPPVLIIRKAHRDSTPSVMYAFSSSTYLLAMLTSNYALQFVSYPMQVISAPLSFVDSYRFLLSRSWANRSNPFR